MFKIKQYLEIDGHEHGMIIEGTNKNNPLLLFLHGGPGFSQYPFMAAEQLDWLDDVTVCYWDQPGAGMSYNPKTQGKLTLDRFINDCVTVTKHLKQQWNKDKIYLFGHSWGSMLGSLTAHKHPEHYHAYIGAGQLGRHYESAKETVQFITTNALMREDSRVLKKVENVTIDKDLHTNMDYLKLLGYVSKYGGGMKRTGYSNVQAMREIFTCDAFTLKQKGNILPGAQQTYKEIGEVMTHSDLAKMTPHFELPVYIVHGRHDYQTSLLEAERFFEMIEAPEKKMYIFDDSAHSPFVEEKEKFLKIFRTIIARTGVSA